MMTPAPMRPAASAPVLRRAVPFLTVALLLAACGGSDHPRTMAESSNVVLATSIDGPTPFIRFVPLSGQDLDKVVRYHYVIAPKSGAMARPVDVTYTAAALSRLGHVSSGSSVKLPVFGLYANHANQVTLELAYADGSRQEKKLDLQTTAYVEPNAILDRPNILRKRSAPSADLNYFYIKSSLLGPVVIDTDGDIRWVLPAATSGFSSAFTRGGFTIGGQNSVALTRVELDGQTSSATLGASNFTRFHHNIDPGKTGLLGEVDGLIDGTPSIESVLVEFDASGKILKQWDFAALLTRYMRQFPEDPGLFVRPGIDWFHINAATYDPRDDSIIASSRENFVAKFDYSSGDLKWILGDPSKYWYQFPGLRAKALRLESGGLYPIGQHATSITADGLLLMFNDGFPSANQPAGAPAGDARTYSAVSAYAIDPVAMTAREQWRFDYDKTILSQICSSAYMAKGGSMLVNYSVAQNRTKARLVGLDPARQVMFDFEYPTTGCATSWNAEPIGFEGLTIE